MRLRPEARVGLIVFLAMVALAVVYWFFGGLGLRGATYVVNAVFPDAQRLSRGAEVRMAGVLVGKVQSIDLTGDNRAKVVMRISTEYKDKIPEDSIARITSGGVVSVGDYYVEILPGNSREGVQPDGYVRTAELPKLENMVGQVQEVITGLNKTVKSVNDIVGDPKLHRSLERIVSNVEATTAQTMALAQQLQGVVTQNSAVLEGVLANVGSASQDFAAVSRDVRRALETGGIEQMQTALDNAARASENLAAASLKLRQLAEDPSLNAQIRQTIQSASEAAQNAAEITNRLNRIVGGGRRTPGVLRGLGLGGSAVDLYENGSTGDLRLDYNYTLPFGSDNFFRLGLFDIGETTKINLQYGQSLDNRSAVRYGLYASRLGIGYDRRLDDRLNLALDLYRPSHPKLEAKMRYDLGTDWGAWLGVDDVFGRSRTLLGVQYRP